MQAMLALATWMGMHAMRLHAPLAIPRPGRPPAGYCGLFVLLSLPSHGAYCIIACCHSCLLSLCFVQARAWVAQVPGPALSRSQGLAGAWLVMPPLPAHQVAPLALPAQVYVPPHPLVKHWVAVARNASTPPQVFRRCVLAWVCCALPQHLPAHSTRAPFMSSAKRLLQRALQP